MDNSIKLNPIGFVRLDSGTYNIDLKSDYIPALINLDGFTHLQVLWWGHYCATAAQRQSLVCEKPYKKGPEILGIFATRSPVRPNPVLVTNIYVQEINFEKGIIYTPYIDAEEGSPVIDIKPYHKSERIQQCSVPDWCKHWPQWYEDAATFDWQGEFNF
ncbi:tRNA (N6-threonylcarbamoyladenosine(37)-N6)-methyltransferase TrmO [candidate division KSB1 bacterium]|nr:tRNA (N6-threonylcarbamoyladenosine(37)-N6)-methyltransferase TrmO [candidate division KSB1 bacterium]